MCEVVTCQRPFRMFLVSELLTKWTMEVRGHGCILSQNLMASSSGGLGFVLSLDSRTHQPNGFKNPSKPRGKHRSTVSVEEGDAVKEWEMRPDWPPLRDSRMIGTNRTGRALLG